MFFEILTEEFETNGGYYDPPEYGAVWEIVEADTRDKAKYKFIKKHFTEYGAPVKMSALPKISIKALDPSRVEHAMMLIDNKLIKWEDVDPQTKGTMMYLSDFVARQMEA